MRKEKSAVRRAPGAFPIIGVGASAGGLEAFTHLLSALPQDLPIALVFISHLAPEGQGLLPEVLQRATPMPVLEAVDGMTVEPGRLYVIPPAMDMRLAQGKLRLKRQADRTRRMPVDLFLASLAQERGGQAVAVILSGAGSDGSQGVRAVKAAGGFVLAQDDRSAGHDSMPHSAAATGAVDLVLPPAKIAEELARLTRHPWLAKEPAPFFDSEQKALSRIFALMRSATGVDFSLYKPNTISRRLTRRLILHRLQSLDQYLKLLDKNPVELRALHDDLLIHVTHFFRDPEAFKVLRSKVFPRMVKNAPADQPLRIWVPGCSTGEEAYSIAITLLDYLGARADGRQIQIFATDVSETAIERARTGSYPEGIHADVPPELLKRFFSKSEGGYQVTKRVRDICVFAKQNLATDPPFANMDLISCRNVLIYLGPELQKRIIRVFHYALRGSGALLLGGSEAISGFSELFTLGDKKNRLFYRKPGPHQLRADILEAQLVPGPEAAKAPLHPERSVFQEGDVQKLADRILLSNFVPAGVVVNSDLEILNFRGPINRYLEPALGRASLSLLKMIPDDCHSVVRQAVERARKQEAPVRGGSADLTGQDGRTRRITVEVVPFRLPVNNQRHFLILFHEEPAPSAPSGKAAAAGEARLRRELASTKSYLQSIVEEHEASSEELKAANEEIISSNEELQSTNEELETAKEELQAANEELTTLNEELHTRNFELALSNNDLVNLLASVHLAIVMLGSDLRIRRFTPLAEKLLSLIPGDVGRPIGDIKPRFDLPDLESLVSEVIETMTTKELEARDRDGRWYSVRIRPYRTTESKIEGAVIVFVDVDAVKRGVADAKETGALVEAMLDLSGGALAILDHELRLARATPAFLERLGLPASALGRGLFETAGAKWDKESLREALTTLAPGGRFSGLALKVGGKPLAADAVRVPGEGARDRFVLHLA